MSVRTRLKRIQRKRGQEVKSPLPRDVTYEDWLEVFTYYAGRRFFDHEPDFPKALAEYRQAIEDAAKCDDPPFYPPDDYEPNLPRRQRLNRWRRPRNYREVSKARRWLSEMLRRLVEGVRPVTEAEFAELTSWFNANLARVRDLEEQSFPIVIDGQKLPSRGNIYYWLERHGPRDHHAGEIAQQVRLLRKVLGDGG